MAFHRRQLIDRRAGGKQIAGHLLPQVGDHQHLHAPVVPRRQAHHRVQLAGERFPEQPLIVPAGQGPALVAQLLRRPQPQLGCGFGGPPDPGAEGLLDRGNLRHQLLQIGDAVGRQRLRAAGPHRFGLHRLALDRQDRGVGLHRGQQAGPDPDSFQQRRVLGCGLRQGKAQDAGMEQPIGAVRLHQQRLPAPALLQLPADRLNGPRATGAALRQLKRQGKRLTGPDALQLQP